MFCWYSTGCVRREPRKELPYLFVMSTIQEIKTAIGKLSLEERADLISDLCGGTDDSWDLQMKSDAAAGKFGAPDESADSGNRAGQTHG